jgi:hypothetical protein
MRPSPLPDSRPPDAGRRALADVFRDLQIDPAWARQWDGAFAWTGFRLRQEFRAHASEPGEDGEVTRVSATTTVIDEVDADEATVCRTLAALNRLAVGETLLWDGARRRVVSHTGVVLNEGDRAERVRDLGAFSILGLVFAELGADVLAQLLNGRVAAWRHPASGFRDGPDPMLGVKDDVFAVCGEGPSAYADGAEFEAIACGLADGRHYSAGGGREGVAVEVAFGDHDTVLVHAQTEPRHPYLGSGLLLTTKVRPPAQLNGSCAQLAAYLNLLEHRGDLAASPLGAWCLDDGDGPDVVTHTCFYPNALHREGVATRAVRDAIARARWVADVLMPLESLSPRRATDIVMERLRDVGAPTRPPTR